MRTTGNTGLSRNYRECEMKYYAAKGCSLPDRPELLAAGADFDPDNPPLLAYYLLFRFHVVDCPDGEGLLWGMWRSDKWGVICRDNSEKGMSIHYFSPELINLTDKSFDAPDESDDRLPWAKKEKKRRGKNAILKVKDRPIEKSESLFSSVIRV
jgi:hypothetical protein